MARARKPAVVAPPQLLAVAYVDGSRVVFRLPRGHASRTRADAERDGVPVAMRAATGGWAGWDGPCGIAPRVLDAVPLAAPSWPARLPAPVVAWLAGAAWSGLAARDKDALRRLAAFRKAPGGMATPPIESPVTLEALQLAARDLGVAFEVAELPAEPTELPPAHPHATT